MGVSEPAGHDREFLTFQLGGEDYGVNLLKVQEIRSCEKVTHIANAPEVIKGVVNLRGVIVPIIDMRLKFGFGMPAFGSFNVVIILNVAGRTVGMLVDSVSDVITLTPAQTKPAPDLGTAVSTEYLLGLGTIDKRMVILVDIDKLMSTELGLLEELAA